MTLEVIICTRDRPAELARCLRSLERQTLPPDAVTIVDVGSAPADNWRPSPLPIRLVAAPPGLPLQRNIGLSRATCDLVTFLDDDVELEPDYLAAVTAWFHERTEAAGVSGNITNAPRRSKLARAYRSLFALANDDGRLRSSGDASFLHHPVRPARVDYLSGSNMTYQRPLISDLRFDEALTGYAYMEDVDFALRVRARGELWMLSHAKLVHHETTTTRIPQEAYVAQVLTNACYLFEKHHIAMSLSRTALARRLLGRSLAYLILALRKRSWKPALGVFRGLRVAPRILKPWRVRR